MLQGGMQMLLRAAGERVESKVDGQAFYAARVRFETAVENRTGAEYLTLGVPGKISRAYRGVLEVTSRHGILVPVVIMDLETAVAAAVEAESPPGSTLEAMKAQAVVTRSYYLAAPRHRKFDFCDTTHCQFIRGPVAPGSLAWMAAEATRGLVMTYRGKPFAALFSSSCGGRTRSLAEVGLHSAGYPYYPVPCPYCLRHATRWRRVLTFEQAGALLKSPENEIARLQIDRKLGWEAVPGNNYSLEVAGNSVVIEGRGQGHGVGLCQRGAAAMAAEGRSFREILSIYFPNTSLGEGDAANLHASSVHIP